jgi:hypothetical protein
LICAPGPKAIPEGLKRKRFAPAIVDAIVPSIEEGEPPVTRPMMLLTDPGPEKKAV